MNKIDFLSFDETIIKGYLYDDVTNPKGIVQITHGMAEHGKRYDDFAQFLNKNGYIVFLYDQRGHGETCGDLKKLGQVGLEDFFLSCVKDQGEISAYIKDKYPNLKFILFGHSFGSFVTQKYIQTYDFPDKVILSGSGKQTGFIPFMGKIVAKLTKTFKGKDAQAKLITNMSFGGYEKHFAKEGDPLKNNWLSSDQSQVEKYNGDPLCGATFSAGFYDSFLSAMKTLYTPKGLSKIPQEIPILIISGADDPVGDYSKGVEALTKTYIDSGHDNVEMKLYPKMRHEILNETSNQTVYDDILLFIEK